jgi:signal transduction histidine kinase
VNVLFPDGPGEVWAGYPNGTISVYHNGVIRKYGPKDGLPEGAVRNIVKGIGGELWLAGEGGLARFKNGRFERASVEGNIQLDNVAQEDDGSLWLSGGGRLLKTDVREFARAAGNPEYRASVTPYGANDGLMGVVKFVARSGKRIWVATSDGLWYLDTDRHRARNPLPPPVRIETVKADGKIMAASPGLKLPKLTHSLQIDYTAFSFVIPERVQFRYKLEGVDTDWQDPGSRRQAYYSDPPPGKHRFWVKACNSDGVWNNAGASFDFSIAPAYYQTGWFQSACVVASLAFLWGLYRYRLHQVIREFHVRIEERVSERTRLARDLHDTLLQSFHGLMLHLQTVSKLLPEGKAKEQLEKTMDRADRAIAEGRSAVYDLRSSATTTNDLAEAVDAVGKELSSDSTSVFTLMVEGPTRDLHPIIRDEIYRISREALSNAFKHAHARHIEAEISYGPRAFKLRIRDDGGGIPAEVLDQGRAGHFGLPGMRERAKQIGAELTIWSSPDTGTEIDLSLASTIAYGTPLPRSPFRLFQQKVR